MAKQSYVLLNSTAGLVNIVGDPIRAAGYFGSSRGIHTVAAYLKDFTGRLYIEGTLANNPGPDDWFPLKLTQYDYSQYPVDPAHPNDRYGDTGVDSFTFEANIVWVRARVDRSYLVHPDDPHNGSIQKVLINF